MKKPSTVIYFLVTTIGVFLYWSNVRFWLLDDVDLFPIIMGGIAANGAFIANIVLTIIEQNEIYKSKNNNEDMWLVKNFKSIFKK